MPFGLGDELSVKVGAATSEFTAKMSAAKSQLEDFGDEATQTAASATVLSGRLERVGDRLTGISGKATAASAGMATLSASTNGLNAGVTLLGTSLSVTLIPAFALLATTVFPLVAAFGGLAAILGSIVGIGAAGVASALAVNFQQLKETALAVRDAILQAIQPVAEVFTPVLQDILRLLPGVIANLIPARSELQAFANNMEAFARAVFNALPPLVELAVELANRFLPVLTDLVQGAGSRLPGLIRELVGVFGDVLVILRPLATEIADNADEFTELGLTTLRVVVPALTKFVSVAGDVSNAVNGLDSNLSQLSVTGTFVVAILGTIAATLGGTVAAVIGAVGLAVAGLAKAWKNNFANIRTITQNLVAGVSQDITRIVNALNNVGITAQSVTNVAKAAFGVLAVVVQTQLQILSGAIQVFTDFVATTFSALFGQGSAIDKFAAFFKRTFKGIVSFLQTNPLVQAVLDIYAELIERSFEFGKQLRVTFFQIGNSVFNAFATAFEGIGGVVVTIFNGIVETVTSALNTVISTVNNAIAAAQNAGLSVGIQQFDQLQAGGFTAQAPTVQRRTTNRGQIRRQQNINTNVNVTVTVEDGEFVAKVKEVSEETIRKRERRTNRLRDRGSSV